ncbi:MAG: universal stress protein [Haloarculaceae archaeon]
MFDRILVPTDGSDVAVVAESMALALAKRDGADVHAIHVREERVRPVDASEEDDASGRHGDSGRDTPTADVGRRALDSFAERAAEVGVEATTAVLDRGDTVPETIVAYAAANDVDCIVVGTHGWTGLDRYVLGSVAERTVRIAPVPVLTVHEDADTSGDFETLLVPTDGSESALAATERAVDVCEETGASLHVIHVVDTNVLWGDVDAARVFDALEDAGEQALHSSIAVAEGHDVQSVRSALLNGSPVRAILDYATEEDVDCIVMGTHGRTGLDRYLLGSVAERVVRLSPVPVLTVSASDRPDVPTDADGDGR